MPKQENPFTDTFAFVADTTAFKWENAHGCAMASYLAYGTENTIKSQMKKWSAEHQFVSANGTQAFVMSTDRLVLVAFRGTEPKKIEDWLTDLQFDLVDGPLDGKVHAGFSSALGGVWQRILKAIADLRRDQPKSLWFTGHSLGAALACLAVSRLKDEDRPVDGLYTFGQPRTGDRQFARALNFEFKPYMFRFVHNNDIVTRVPPRSLGYSHAGTFRYFDEDGKYHTDISNWNRFLDRIHGRMEDVFEWGSDGIKDHDMKHYLELVGKQRRSAEG